MKCPSCDHEPMRETSKARGAEILVEFQCPECGYEEERVEERPLFEEGP